MGKWAPGYFTFLKFIYLFRLCWVSVAAPGLSLVAERGGHSSSRCEGFSLWGLLLFQSTGSREHRLQQLRHLGSVVVTAGLSCSEACGIFLDQGSNPCPALAGGFLTTRPRGTPLAISTTCQSTSR